MAEDAKSTKSQKNNALPLNESKLVPIKVVFLDGCSEIFKLLNKCPGQELFDMVISKLNIPEPDYFDLEFMDKDGNYCWLDHFKPLSKPLRNMALLTPSFEFSVKFYSSHPNLLENDYTRFLFALQIKKNLYNGTLQCCEDTKALLLAFIVQSEIGDYKFDDATESTHTSDVGYLKKLKLVKHPKNSLLEKIFDLHKTLQGMNSTEADYCLLDSARKLEHYGIRTHVAKDHENLPLNLGVGHTGIIVFQGNNKINTFNWSKIRKLSFKRKKFLINLHSDGYIDLFVIWLVEGYYNDNVEFFFDSRNACKNFWKKCVENHAFFRSLNFKGQIGAGSGGSVGSFFNLCKNVPHPYISKLALKDSNEDRAKDQKSDDRNRSRSRKENILTRPKKSFFRSGSCFRYVGRTQKQLLELSQEKESENSPISMRSSSAGRIYLRHHLNLNEPLQKIFNHQAELDNSLDAKKSLKNKSKSHSNIHDKSKCLANHYRLLLLSTNQFSSSVIDNSRSKNISHSQSASLLKELSSEDLTTRVPRMPLKSMTFSTKRDISRDRTEYARLLSPKVTESRTDLFPNTEPRVAPVQENKIVPVPLQINDPDLLYETNLEECDTRTFSKEEEVITAQLAKFDTSKSETTNADIEEYSMSDLQKVNLAIEEAYQNYGPTDNQNLPDVLQLGGNQNEDWENFEIVQVPSELINEENVLELPLTPRNDTTSAPINRFERHRSDSERSNFDEPNSIIGGSLEAISMITGFSTWSNWDETIEVLNNSNNNKSEINLQSKTREISRARSEPDNANAKESNERSNTLDASKVDRPLKYQSVRGSSRLKKHQVGSKSSVYSISKKNKIIRNRLYNILKELYNTEKTYLNDLKIFTHFLIEHLKKSENLTLIDYFASEIWPILRNIENFHKSLYEAFSVRICELEQANYCYSAHRKKLMKLYRLSNKENLIKYSISQINDSKKNPQSISTFTPMGSQKNRKYRHNIRDLKENRQSASDDSSESERPQEENDESQCSSDENSVNITPLDMESISLCQKNPLLNIDISNECLRQNENDANCYVNNSDLKMNEEIMRMYEKNLINSSKIADIFCQNIDSFSLYDDWISGLRKKIWNIWRFTQDPVSLEDFVYSSESPQMNESQHLTEVEKSINKVSSLSDPEDLENPLFNAKRSSSSPNLESDGRFNSVYSDSCYTRSILKKFESVPLCYKSLIELLLQPHRRLLYYRALFINLTVIYPYSYQEYIDTRVFFQSIGKLVQNNKEKIIESERLANGLMVIDRVCPSKGLFHTSAKLRDNFSVYQVPENSSTLMNEETCVTGRNRTLIDADMISRVIRIGWLQKHSNRGYQARMIFLYKDRLAYTSKVSTYFKLHGLIGLAHATVVLNPQFNQQSIRNQKQNQYSFAIIVPANKVPQSNQTKGFLMDNIQKKRRIIFNAPSEEIRQLWFTDIRKQIEYASSNEYLNSSQIPNKIYGFFRILDNLTFTENESTKAPSSRLESRSIFDDPFNSEAISLLQDSDTGLTNEDLTQCSILFRANRIEERFKSSQTNQFIDNKLQLASTKKPKKPIEKNSWSLNVPLNTHESNNLLYLCWHRHQSLSMQDLINSAECEMSGYLLRKFKNNSGWQKLWAVFSNMCLYFYKSQNDVKPLASLPLFGYRLEMKFRDPNVIKLPDLYLEENVLDKSNIICVTYKSHVYLFRAQNSYMYIKWCESFQCILHGNRPHHLDLLENILLESADNNIDDGNIDTPDTDTNQSNEIFDQNLTDMTRDDLKSENNCALSEASFTAVNEEDDFDDGPLPPIEP